MSQRSILLVAATLLLGGCNVLDTNPPDQTSTDNAVKTPAGARAALAGAYNELQDGYYYGGTMTHFGDLYADNANEVGTFTSYKSAAQRDLFADNGDITGMWNHIYDAIKRVNTLIAKVPNIDGFEAGEQEQILGEAYFLRALNYHNLVRHFGGVPLRLEPLTDAGGTGEIVRATPDEVYTQIAADLTEAENRITAVTGPVNHATLGAVYALQARIASYRGNYGQVISKANQVLGLGYALAPDYSSLFNGPAARTPENIFTLVFTDQVDQANLFGYYWLSDQLSGADAGRYEIGPNQAIINAYDTTSTDARFLWNIQPDPGGDGYVEATQSGGSYGSKWRTAGGAEDFHVIRLAEVLLLKADAFARTALLDSAIATVNLLRVRADADPLVPGTAFDTEAEVLAAVDHERRIEFFAEGDRWGDLVRQGTAATVLGINPNKVLWPIPQSEIDVAPGVIQNPGY
jgi:hypothetical protein